MWDCMSLEVSFYIINTLYQANVVYILFYIGNISIADFHYNVNDSVITFITTGGPATIVTWTRDSKIIPDNDDNTQVTVLDNSNTGQYTHTLNISGMAVPGVYGCSVSNNKPSLAKAVGVNTEGTELYIYS